MISLLPIVVFFIAFQLIWLKLPKSQIIKITVGIIYATVGLILFLTGVNAGFLPMGLLSENTSGLWITIGF